MGKKLLVSLLFAMAVLGSCTKDSDTLNNKLSAKIGSKNWNAAIRLTNLTNDVFVITGTSTTGEVLVITILGKNPDLYEFSLTSQKCNATYKKSALTADNDIYTSVSGKVNLTKVDMTTKKISGTFEFTLTKTSLTDYLTVSSGSFNDLEFTSTSL
jgi:hypothetical protein